MNNSISETTSLWTRALEDIQKKLDEPMMFDSFFSESYINDVSGNTITIVVNSSLAAQLLQTKYYETISETINELTESEFQLKFIDASEVAKIITNSNNTINKKANYFEGCVVNSSLSFDNFVVGSFNREASQAALLIARNPGKMFNPLFIHSNSGLGKTHLLHAIGNYIKREGNPNARILYVSGNDFVDEYVKYVRGVHESESLRDFVSQQDVLLFDDIQFLAEKVKTQEMFFDIYQKMVNSGKQIVVTSDKNPNELKNLEERLVTRFNQGLVVKINEPDQNTCVSILEKKIESNGLDITKFDPSVIYFLADKFSHNVRELEGAINRLVFHLINEKETERVTMDVAAKAVSSLLEGKSIATQMNEQKIINIVADYYNLTPGQITGKMRTGQIALARHISMYLIRNNLDVPLKKIGDMFGGKDHTTVMNAIAHVDKELKTNEQLRAAIEELQAQIKK